MGNKIEDLEILKKLMEKEMSLEEISAETKERLVKMCSKRLEDIRKKIEDKNKEIKILEEIINKNT